jgi:hypothetical protein
VHALFEGDDAGVVAGKIAHQAGAIVRHRAISLIHEARFGNSGAPLELSVLAASGTGNPVLLPVYPVVDP